MSYLSLYLMMEFYWFSLFSELLYQLAVKWDDNSAKIR